MMKKQLLRRSTLAIFLSLVLLFTAGCSGNNTGNNQTPNNSDNQTQDDGGSGGTTVREDPTTLRVAMNQKIDVIDGSNGNGLATQVMLHVGDPLARSTVDGGIEPCLALSWESLDEFTWQFKLREGVKFTNGEEFNAEAVKVTIEYIAEYFRYSSQFGDAWPVSAEVVDDYIVNISTPAYCPDLPALLARVPIFAPQQYLEEGAEEFFTHTVCTGPYIIESFDAGLSCTLVANEEYWGGAPTIKTIVFDWVADETARVSGLLAGDYDFSYVIPLSSVDTIDSEANLVVDIYPVVGTDMIFFNGNASADSWIHNPQFRLACIYAIDHAAIRDSLMGGYPEILAGIADVSTLGAIDTWELTYDPDEAARILEEIGYDGDEIAFYYFSGEFSGQDEVSEAVAAYLETAGIAVDLQVMEEAAYNEEAQAGNVDIVSQRMPGPYYGGSIYYMRQMGTESRNNSTQFEDVQQLLSEANAYGLTEEERVEILEEANALYWSYYPVIWGVHEVASNGLASDLKGVINLPNSFCMFYDCYFE